MVVSTLVIDSVEAVAPNPVLFPPTIRTGIDRRGRRQIVVECGVKNGDLRDRS